ncbi:hypothetical protein IPdc08_01058 [archaeon]|nr:hypothetical protein IPdc08_01058 [archaeon]
MPTTVAKYRYITKDTMIHGGEPVIIGTRFPVRSVVFYTVKEGMLPEELVKEFPQLTLAAIYEALSYYYDHRDEIDSLLAVGKFTVL